MAPLDGDALNLTRERLSGLFARADEYRRDPGRWPELACSVADRRDTWHDRHERARFEVLTALRYDRRDGDTSLLRFLFEQEIRRAAEDPFQGAGSMSVAAFLVARARDPADLRLFGRAKRANFDTHCGFDREFLFAAGIDAAMAALAALPDDDREALADLMLEDGKPIFSAEDLASWWRYQETWYETPWETEDPLVLLELARWANDHAWCTALIDSHERSLARDASSLANLARLRRENGELEAALAAARAARAAATDPSRHGSLELGILELLVALGRFDEAARMTPAAFALIAQDSWWHRIGLGRRFVETCFRIARGLPRGRDATAYVRSVHAIARALDGHTAALLEEGEAAARKHHRLRTAAWYARQRRALRRRLRR